MRLSMLCGVEMNLCIGNAHLCRISGLRPISPNKKDNMFDVVSCPVQI